MCRSFIEYGQICADDREKEVREEDQKKLDAVCQEFDAERQEFDAERRLTVSALLQTGQSPEEIASHFPYSLEFVREVATTL